MLWHLYENSELANIDIVESIFATMEGGCPFKVDELTITQNGAISLSNWISIWQMLIRNDYEVAFEYILYLGYDKTLKDFVRVVDTSSWKLSEKNVIECAVVERVPIFLNKFFKPAHETTRSTTFSLPNNKTLILRQKDVKDISKTKKIDMCLFIHDGTRESADFIITNYEASFKKLPKAIVDIWKEGELGAERVLIEKPSIGIALESNIEIIKVMSKLIERL